MLPGSSSCAHTHKPLGRSEIRVLELLPASCNTPVLHGRLHTLDVEFHYKSNGYAHWNLYGLSTADGRRMRYTALSYVWEYEPYMISIGRSNLGITRTSETALRYLRHEQDAAMIWVDLICINQNDTQEEE